MCVIQLLEALFHYLTGQTTASLVMFVVRSALFDEYVYCLRNSKLLLTLYEVSLK